VLSPYDAYIARAVRDGEEYLRENQDPDGCWRDYALKPGPSEGWTTAFVGLCLASGPTGLQHWIALQRAASALGSLHQGGWGYNRYSTTDADSTACAVRFLSALGRITGGPALLRRFLDEDGHAHTFVETGAGRWGAAHDDVTPMVGLALVSVAGDRELIMKIRSAVLRSRTSAGIWHSYWWATDAYATAQSLEFLEITGGIPTDVDSRARLWLEEVRPQSAFEAALAVDICCRLDGGGPARMLIDLVLNLQSTNGQWPPSQLLLVPGQTSSDSSVEPVAYADHQGLMSTALAVRSLKRALSSSLWCATRSAAACSAAAW
jgi:hypothetical protein